MSIIKILSPEEAKKVAAGEVVERPASVIKELLENSLDAGATTITVYVEKAGKQLLRVVDNGCGMEPDDAQRCFDNHATSKLTSIADLAQLDSFGFRGEALASISSVSKVTLQTRYREEKTGVSLEYADGKILSKKSVACAVGTDLQIRDLFYNTPVRKKFLKQDETEWNQIQNLVQAFCLSNISIHFKLYRDDRMILNAPAEKMLKDRVTQLWGHNFSQNLRELVSLDTPGKAGHSGRAAEKKQNFVINNKLAGLISNHNFWRYGRQQIFFFVNNRWVKNSELSKALMKGYRNVLPPARFPATFLFLTLDNDLVDINVHPRKEEVRFVKPVTIENLVQRAVTQTLEGLINKQLGAGAEPPLDTHASRALEVSGLSKFVSTPSDKFSTKEQVTLSLPASESMAYNAPAIQQELQNQQLHTVLPLVSPARHSPCPPKPWRRLVGDGWSDHVEAKSEDGLYREMRAIPQPSFKIIGQVLKTYIVAQNEEGLVLIDQHAAHERILYEKYLKNFEQKDGTRLLFPQIIKLNEHQQKIVLREKEFLLRQGIEVEKIGENEIAIKTSPPKIQDKSLQELIFEMIEFIENNENLDSEVFRKKLNEHVHSHMACKMAVKAGDELSVEMMQNILNDLQTVDNRFICIHGRPTTWSISQAELEKRFRRRGP
ncbi:DNA mismatch repair endonuclease MutL [Candidatus Babeliales bacterium]|nr:DNA mismatch repair endonuclease MutL [Candidatus Babeliales bacterium]